MDTLKRYFPSFLWGLSGGLVGVFLLLFALDWAGMLYGKSPVQIRFHGEFREWLSDTSGLIGGFLALGGALWTIRWIKKQYDELKQQNALIRSQNDRQAELDLISDCHDLIELDNVFYILEFLHLRLIHLKDSKAPDVEFYQFLVLYRQISFVFNDRGRSITIFFDKMGSCSDTKPALDLTMAYASVYYSYFGDDPSIFFKAIGQKYDYATMIPSLIEGVFSEFFEIVDGEVVEREAFGTVKTSIAAVRERLHEDLDDVKTQISTFGSKGT